MWEDPIVKDVRQVRKEHAARFNYDPVAIYNDLRRLQQESGREYVDLSHKPSRVASHAPCHDRVIPPQS